MDHDDVEESMSLEINCYCCRCGRASTRTLDKRMVETVKLAMWPLIGCTNWDDYIIWLKRTALCSRCCDWVAERAEAEMHNA